MHIEICIEDSSGQKFLEIMLPKIFENYSVTWRVHGYGGIGRLPKNLTALGNARHRALLNTLPKLIRGCVNTPWIDVLVVIVDSDDRDRDDFLDQLKFLASSVDVRACVKFYLAIEEMEAWYFGDESAIIDAYPNAKSGHLLNYAQDSICGTWEKLADAVVPGGVAKINSEGWPASGVAKAEWAEKITPYMIPDRNISPSFIEFRDGLRSLLV